MIIIGILAAIAIPTFLAQREKADIAACRSDTRNAAEAATLVAADDNGSYATVTTATAEATGWAQTDGVTTTFTPINAGADIEISSTCPPGAPTPVTFTTDTADPDHGKVMGP